jgi:hypothetical protein
LRLRFQPQRTQLLVQQPVGRETRLEALAQLV